MDASNVCPTEDTLCVLLEYLVDPLLPVKSSQRHTPSQSQQESVAKQVHAAVLIYNYYHRGEHPHLEYLDFESFCKLAGILKPSLLSYMKFMLRSTGPELDEPEKQLSVVEKMIMDACDTCTSLDGLKDIQSIEGWPISKVTVFLVDSKKEICYLQFGSITQGIWNLIEKNTDVYDSNSEAKLDGTYINKRKRIGIKPVRDELVANEDIFQQLAFSAVKEATGINQNDLIIMEGHVVYSLSKEKTAVRFYIMQYIIQKNDERIQIPITDVIHSLLGPLVQKSSGLCTVTPVIEYFHLLPYSRILSDWLSREMSFNGSPAQRLKSGTFFEDLERAEKSNQPGVQNCRDRSLVDGLRSSINVDALKKNDNNGCLIDSFSSDLNKSHDMNVDDTSMAPSRNVGICKNIAKQVQTDKLEGIGPCMEDDLNAATSNAKAKVNMVDSRMMPCIADCRDEGIGSREVIYQRASSDQNGVPMGNCAVVTYESSSNGPNRLQAILSSAELSKTALRALVSKKKKLILQQSSIEDEIAKCDKNIQIILNGGEDDLAIKIESIVEGFNDKFLEIVTEDTSIQRSLDKYVSQSTKVRRLSEAVLNMQNPCQELDAICDENIWVSPTYHSFPSDGGYKAEVRLKGLDFDYSICGDPRSNPKEARESAAAQMLAKLRGMARQLNAPVKQKSDMN